MPLSGPASYLPTTQEFVTHWTAVNANLGAANAVVLEGGVTLDDLTDLLADLRAQHSAVQDAITDLSLARGQLELDKAAALNAVGDFNERVRADLGSTAFARALPRVPTLSDGEEVFTVPLATAARIWLKINARAGTPKPPDLVLKGGLTQTAFATLLGAVRQGYADVRDGEADLKLAREQRNDMQDRIQPVLKKYRQTVPTRFPDGDALIDSLPLLTPRDGHTPKPPVATARWNAAEGKAEVMFTPAADEPTAERFELRWCPGEEYSTDDESTVDSLPASGVGPAGGRFLTLQGLDAPGARAQFRVVVVLRTGNEAGSEPVRVTRPAG